MLKQFIGHVANEQQSSMALSVGSFLWGQQSMSSMEDDMSSMEDMCDVSAVFMLTAARPEPGSMATESAIIKIKMVRPTCMSPLLYRQNSRFPAHAVK